MNVLSIDVGMKNLAYCILKVENNEYKIIDWDVINLCNDKKYICQFPTKKNGICEKKQDIPNIINIIVKYIKNQIINYLRPT